MPDLGLTHVALSVRDLDASISLSREHPFGGPDDGSRPRTEEVTRRMAEPRVPFLLICSTRRR